MKRPGSALAGVLLTVVGGVASAQSVSAQSVRGSVTRDGVGIEGAVLLLIDSAGHVVARSASRESGTFTVAAERPGRYSLRVLRIGFAPTLAGPVQLAAGATATLDVALTGRAVRIAELRVVDRAPCQVRPDSDAVAFRLWDQARTALLATALTQREQFSMRTTTYERRFDVRGEHVTADSTLTRTVPTVRPFASLPPDSLASSGYVLRDARGGMIFWAPDADVLLSESFASTHCLRPERAASDSSASPRWVGIAFLPSGAARAGADIEGVLWLDAETAELRRLDYRYVNLPDFARLPAGVRAGGRVEFLRLPTGAWIVPRWSIRTPLAGAPALRRPTAVVPGMLRDAPSNEVELTGVQITGGDVSEVSRGGRTIWERGRVGFRVRVTDATRSVPVPASALTMDDTPDSSTTGADGVALFPRVLPGPHRLGVRTATMAALGARPLTVPVTVPDEQAAPFLVQSPTDRALLAAVCGERVAARHESLLRGSLRTTALPVPDARVEASWQAAYILLGGGELVSVPRRVTATTNTRGEFVMCGVPRGLAVTLRALRGRSGDAPATVMIPSVAVVAEQPMVVEP
jgi:hypothetical protein